MNVGAEAGQGGREVFDARSIFAFNPDGIGVTLGPRLPSRREIVESAAVEYPLALPAVKPLRLDAAISGSGTFWIKVAPFSGGPWTTLFEGRGVRPAFGQSAPSFTLNENAGEDEDEGEEADAAE